MLIVVFEHQYLSYGSMIYEIEESFRGMDYAIQYSWGQHVSIGKTSRTILYKGMLTIVEEFSVRSDKENLLQKMVNSDSFYLVRVQSMADYDFVKQKFSENERVSFKDNHRPDLQRLFESVSKRISYLDESDLKKLWRRSAYDYYVFTEYVILLDNCGFRDQSLIDSFEHGSSMNFYTFANNLLFHEMQKNQRLMVKYLYKNRHNKKLIPRLKQYYKDIQTVQEYIMVNSSCLSDEVRQALPNVSDYAREQCTKMVLESSNEYLGYCLARCFNVLKHDNVVSLLNFVKERN